MLVYRYTYICINLYTHLASVRYLALSWRVVRVWCVSLRLELADARKKSLVTTKLGPVFFKVETFAQLPPATPTLLCSRASSLAALPPPPLPGARLALVHSTAPFHTHSQSRFAPTYLPRPPVATSLYPQHHHHRLRSPTASTPQSKPEAEELHSLQPAMSRYGKFDDFCRDTGNIGSTLPVCNLFNQATTKRGTGWGGCDLEGFSVGGGERLRNLGSIILCGIAIVATAFLLWRTQRKKAAVGRREMQLFLLGYILISICEIFTIGGFPLNDSARLAFTAIHIAAITATSWILMLNGAVGYQLLDDGTAVSVGLLLISSLIIFVGTGYIALDTGFSWTGYWESTLARPNQAYALYTLYQLVPLLFIVIFFLLEAFLVLRILGERKPMLYLLTAALLFAIGQIFQYVISVHICTGTDGKINGGLFSTLFTLLSIVMIWIFWSSITEDDWPMPTVTGAGYN